MLCGGFAKQVSEQRQIAHNFTKKTLVPGAKRELLRAPRHQRTNTRIPVSTLKGGGPIRTKFRDAESRIMSGMVLCRGVAKQASERRQIAHEFTKKRGSPEQSESCFEHLCTAENHKDPIGYP